MNSCVDGIWQSIADVSQEDVQRILKRSLTTRSLQRLSEQAYLQDDAYFASRPLAFDRVYYYLVALFAKAHVQSGVLGYFSSVYEAKGLYKPSSSSSSSYDPNGKNSPLALLFPTNLFDAVHQRPLFALLWYEPFTTRDVLWMTQEELVNAWAMQTHTGLCALSSAPPLPLVVFDSDTTTPLAFSRTTHLTSSVLAHDVSILCTLPSKAHLLEACRLAVRNARTCPRMALPCYSVVRTKPCLVLPIHLPDVVSSDLCIGLECVADASGPTTTAFYHVKSIMSLEQARLCARLLSPIEPTHWLFASVSFGNSSSSSSSVSEGNERSSIASGNSSSSSVHEPSRSEAIASEASGNSTSFSSRASPCVTPRERILDPPPPPSSVCVQPTDHPSSSVHDVHHKAEGLGNKKPSWSIANINVFCLRLPPCLQMESAHEKSTILQSLCASFSNVGVVKDVELFSIPDRFRDETFVSAVVRFSLFSDQDLYLRMMEDKGRGRDASIRIPVVGFKGQWISFRAYSKPNVSESKSSFFPKLSSSSSQNYDLEPSRTDSPAPPSPTQEVVPLEACQVRPRLKLKVLRMLQSLPTHIPVSSFFEEFESCFGMPLLLEHALEVSSSSSDAAANQKEKKAVLPTPSLRQFLSMCGPEVVLLKKSSMVGVSSSLDASMKDLGEGNIRPFPIYTAEQLQQGWELDPTVRTQLLECLKKHPLFHMSRLPNYYASVFHQRLDYATSFRAKGGNVLPSPAPRLTTLLLFFHPHVVVQDQWVRFVSDDEVVPGEHL